MFQVRKYGKKLNPQSRNYFDLYMDIASVTAQQSTSEVLKVGACLVTESGMLSIGWNGTPTGFDNSCEYSDDQKRCEITGELRPKTKLEVIHAERNALDKLLKQGVSSNDAVLFLTHSPCIECAKTIAQAGIKCVVFKDTYKDVTGLEFLLAAQVKLHMSNSYGSAIWLKDAKNDESINDSEVLDVWFRKLSQKTPETGKRMERLYELLANAGWSDGEALDFIFDIISEVDERC